MFDLTTISPPPSARRCILEDPLARSGVVHRRRQGRRGVDQRAGRTALDGGDDRALGEDGSRDRRRPRVRDLVDGRQTLEPSGLDRGVPIRLSISLQRMPALRQRGPEEAAGPQRDPLAGLSLSLDVNPGLAVVGVLVPPPAAASCFAEQPIDRLARRGSRAWPSSARTSRFWSTSATYPDGKPSLNHEPLGRVLPQPAG